jgi:hypothetical protein
MFSDSMFSTLNSTTTHFYLAFDFILVMIQRLLISFCTIFGYNLLYAPEEIPRKVNITTKINFRVFSMVYLPLLEFVETFFF